MRNRAQRGFTLLEMLVAITVFGLLVSMVYGMLRMGSRGWEAGDERIDHADAMRIGWSFLHRALSNAREVENLEEDGEGIHFLGAEDKLEFVADMPAYLGTGGLHVVTLSVADAELGPDQEGPEQKLLLQRIPLLDYQSDDEGADELLQSAALVDQLDSLEIEYFGVLEDDEESAQWHTEWTEAPALPVLIRITVRPYGRAAWPILIAHPQLGKERKAEGEAGIPGEDPDAAEPADGAPDGEEPASPQGRGEED